MPLKTIGPEISSQPLNDNLTYLESLIFGQDNKPSVRVATTANIVLSGTQTIDGVAVIAGDRVLVKDQITASQNGVYLVAVGAWTRTMDADTGSEITSGTMLRVNEGTVNTGSEWYLSTPDAIVPGTTNLTFTQSDGLFTIVDTVVANASAARIATLLSMLGNMIKRITGKSSWPTAPRLTLEDAAQILSGGYKVQSFKYNTGNIAASGSIAPFISFPVAFSTVPTAVMVSVGDFSGGNAMYLAASSGTATGFTLNAYNPNAYIVGVSVNIVAIGT